MTLPLTEEFITDLLTSALSNKAVREDIVNLLSFTSDDAHLAIGSREAKSWAMRLWWKILGKPMILDVVYEVLTRHNRFWVKREIPLDAEAALNLIIGAKR